MAIDDKVQTVELKGKNYQTLLNKAYTKIKKQTKYTGDFGQKDLEGGYFSSFTHTPLTDTTGIIGIKVEYQVNATKAPVKKKKKYASGSTHATKYSF